MIFGPDLIPKVLNGRKTMTRRLAWGKHSTLTLDDDEVADLRRARWKVSGPDDLEQLMREQFYLALPMKPLCREDCQGLCVVCGANLNRATCDCKLEWDDPRLAALKELKTKN